MATIGNWQAATESIWKTSSIDFIDHFKSLKDEIDKIAFMHKMGYIGSVSWLQFYMESCGKLHLKSSQKSTQHRNYGNKLFQEKKYKDALEFYTQSVMEAPDKNRDLGLAYGNHSAACFHLELYQETIESIKLALDNQYPEPTSYKLYLRWAHCLYHTGDMQQASNKVNIVKKEVLENKELEEKRKVKLLEEIKALEENIAKNRSQEITEDNKENQPELFQERNTVLTQASSAVTMKYDKDRGRYLQATCKIPAGSVIIAEKPYATVLLPDHYQTHCHHCIGQLTAILPCRRCSSVLYCSETCRQQSWSVYHQIECQYLDICHSIGIAHLSLRIVLTSGHQHLLDFRDKMSVSEFYQNENRIGGVTEEGTYSKTYLSVYDLMTHALDIETPDSFQYTLTALLLLTILKKSGWLEKKTGDDKITNDNTDDITKLQFSQDDLYIGGLLLRHIEQLVCNAHAITELQVTQTSDTSLVDSKSQERIATAIYPTTSLMNHSCDPSIIPGFDKDILVVRVIKDVEVDEEIFNCYGPHHKRMSTMERQQALKTQYFFTCRCPSCQTGDEQDIFTSYCCPSCKAVLKENETTCSCTSCDFTDQVTMFLTKENKAKNMFISGLKCLQMQDIEGAIQKFTDCLNVQLQVLYKHHKSLAETKDCLAQCYALSKKYNKAIPYLRDSVCTLGKLYGDTSIEYANELHKFAGVLYYAKGFQEEGLSVIDKAVQIFNLHFGNKYELVQELEEMKICMLDKIRLE
ncbi:unnamed protein product [Mytilus coruscus]|uniref:Protein-lysine N-methyltransferase SMYD4 n=1 Tax=Mytilus coruscus TaxID=42192 RepID=A0A6J8CHC3_MYTCO|nr:unnamed protein product [Mytilus coruscus]